jgi:hypothetical protein
MEAKFIERFDSKRDEIKENLSFMLDACKYGIDYSDIVRIVIDAIHEDHGDQNPNAISEIDDGDYQGTLLFVIPEDTYQPYDYWYVRVFYGSCSGCDTLQSILYESDSKEQQINDLFTLALHIFQWLKKLD